MSSPSVLPRKFGRYVLFDFIGKGGMAEIYLARARTDLGVSRLCVVKEILPELASHPQFAEMLIHEAKLAARLNHANIVQVFDLGRADERLYIAMDYVEGFDVNELLRRCSRGKVPLPFEFALHFVGETLKGLGYAHRRVDDEGKPLGIVHRDVSPSNILVSLEGDVKLCDFGIARATEIAVSSDSGGGGAVDEAVKGKAGYMSPEHARGEPIDARSDLFAVGIVLWELLAGRRMYKAEAGGPSLLEQARNAQIPELPVRGFAHEDKLRALVYKALKRDRDQRYPTAQAMLNDLEAYMSDARLMASSLRLGDWLIEKFGNDIVTQRRARERAISALELGAPVTLEPLPPAPTPLPSMVPPRTPPAPNLVRTPPPTLIPPLPPPPFLPLGMSAIDRAPSSIVGASMDVSAPSSQLPVIDLAATERGASSSRSKFLVVTAIVGVAAMVVLALLLMRLV